MPYCTNCGKEVSWEDKFCSGCGSSLIPTTINHQKKRDEEYVGKVKKCPACGESIKSFEAFCSACGHEINSTEVSDSLKDFVFRLNECEKHIQQNAGKEKRGWSTWGKSKKIAWIVFNLCFAFIPLVVDLLMPLLKVNGVPYLTSEEKRKAALIENYVFPNDREAIIEGMLFVKTKVESIVSIGVDKKSAYWGKLWINKATQLYKKAQIVIPGDPIVEETYLEIKKNKKKLKNLLGIKLLLGIMILLLFIGVVAYRSGSIDMTDYSVTYDWPKEGLAVYLPEPENDFGRIKYETEKQVQIDVFQYSQKQFDDYAQKCRDLGFNVDISKTDTHYYADTKEGLNLNIFYSSQDDVMEISIDSYNANTELFEENSYKTVTYKNFSFDIPNYWDEEGSKKEHHQFYAEKGGKVAMLSISYPVDGEDPVNMDALIADNENMIIAIEKAFPNCEVYDYEEFESNYGIKGILYKITFVLEDFWKDHNMKGLYYCFPSPEDNRWFVIVMGVSDNVENDYYEEDYLKTLKSIKAK